ncbi:MAG TPA: sigma factor-like helix-turn-helix DNA-binding protein [Acidimicrobiia bacterium]|nr:sigma factor-like helix-turn-helix DNA-binding protein [Acidimicrobiia bacterium]
MGIEERWDPEGIQHLRELYGPLRRFAAVIGRWDVDPDDLVQDAYTKVLQKHPSQIRDLGPYLRRTIVNLATDQRRRAVRGNNAVHRLGDDVVSSDHYPSDLEDLLRLQPRVRALLFLVEVEGHQIADAADVVGMSGSNARVALMRARRRLRSELSAEASGE